MSYMILSWRYLKVDDKSEGTRLIQPGTTWSAGKWKGDSLHHAEEQNGVIVDDS